MRYLRDNGATIVDNELGWKLCEAAAEDKFDTLQMLHASGCNLEVGDYDARTCMHIAACENKLHIIKWLLGIGVRFDIKDRYGNTPLDDAKRYNHQSIVKCLKAL